MKFIYKCDRASYPNASMYKQHRQQWALSEEYENRVDQSAGLGEDFKDFRAYLGAKTTHQMSVEAAAAAHKETMHTHIDKNWDLRLEEKELKQQLRSLSMDLNIKTSSVHSLQAQSNEMLANLKAVRNDRDRMQRRKNELTGNVSQASSPWDRTTQLASFGG